MGKYFSESKEDIQKMSDDEFFKYMEEFNRHAAQKRKLIFEARLPEFKTIEEVKKFYNGITMEEFENKMFEK